MRSNRAVLGLIVVGLVVFGGVSACGGAAPEPVEPTEAPAAAPTEPPAEAATEAPTEPPAAEPTEAPTEEPTEQPVTLDGRALLDERCDVCHSLRQTEAATKSREEWDDNVTRMVDRGAKLTDEEKTVLIDYLAATYGQ